MIGSLNLKPLSPQLKTLYKPNTLNLSPKPKCVYGKLVYQESLREGIQVFRLQGLRQALGLTRVSQKQFGYGFGFSFEGLGGGTRHKRMIRVLFQFAGGL